MRVKAADVYFGLALLFALLCLLVSPLWTYLGNLVLGLPAFGASGAFYWAARRVAPDARRLRWIPRLWLLSGLSALVSLVVLLVTN